MWQRGCAVLAPDNWASPGASGPQRRGCVAAAGIQSTGWYMGGWGDTCSAGSELLDAMRGTATVTTPAGPLGVMATDASPPAAKKLRGAWRAEATRGAR